MKGDFEKIEKAYKGHMKCMERKKIRELLKAKRKQKAVEAHPARPRERLGAGWRDLADDDFNGVPPRGHHRPRPTGQGTEEPVPDLADAAVFQDGVVTAVSPRECLVLVDGSEVACTLAREIRERQQSEIAVGDRATVERRPNGRGVVRLVHEPETVLTRPDPLIAGRTRRIASNVDAVAIVVSVVAPPLRVRIVDRILIAVQRGGARACLVVNKVDLLDGNTERDLAAALVPYVALGIGVHRVSAVTGEGIERLRADLADRTTLFCGHSGVGKTSILNAIAPGLDLSTGSVSTFSSKGTHTTTTSRLYVLPSGARIIDSPGIRQFGLDAIDRRSLPWYFPEFAPLQGQCRYADCAHVQEPDCAVRSAARAGAIHPARYDTYLRILGSID